MGLATPNKPWPSSSAAVVLQVDQVQPLRQELLRPRPPHDEEEQPSPWTPTRLADRSECASRSSALAAPDRPCPVRPGVLPLPPPSVAASPPQPSWTMCRSPPDVVLVLRALARPPAAAAAPLMVQSVRDSLRPRRPYCSHERSGTSPRRKAASPSIEGLLHLPVCSSSSCAAHNNLNMMQGARDL